MRKSKVDDPIAAESFFARVLKTETCWFWIGTKNPDGYGQLTVSKYGTQSAHRWAYEYLKGPIPDGLCIDHLCRLRNCVNPDHLEPVTPSENSRRGMGANFRNKMKTHCDQGHEFTPENTYLYEGVSRNKGSRKCRTCRAQIEKRRYDRIRATGRPVRKYKPRLKEAA